MSHYGCMRQGDRLIIAVDVVRVPVGVDNVRHAEVLLPRALHQHLWGVRRVDQDRDLRLPVAEQVAKVAIASCADLFEDERHTGTPLSESNQVRVLKQQGAPGVAGPPGFVPDDVNIAQRTMDQIEPDVGEPRVAFSVVLNE